MTLVVDASAVAGWLLPDENGPDLAALVATHADFLAPWLLWAELRNILIVTERRGRLPQGLADQLIEAVEGLGILLDTAPSNAGVLSLARRHGLTVYDALYLDLAQRRGAMLSTLDAKLAQAARAEGVSLA
ncbi:PIN domain-containing protein [Rhodobacter sphaeroides]|uniref:Ribonuclease VapC n=1 Tax=Cereibacter sphaeroides (strain ATCC 17023 / DSM 158 / JCM 6121 / CCUG 31486 / LMG 2827 / NBRC 12203 / NCIMB 8253 / ATH 2.4.1.) TaxID=272943 RepID=Q3IV54_CERS4|nr:type II toxin-antitoxin system VapC family toxin [Cereibacter sphaeroides]ABA81580.1 putative nucleic acid-binding protein, contains PIN domain [Cereibacter sphaeroides 2.4.1]AMJ50112.1 nucleic acid-binding protein [Cereibacter sphaeroides]ANS36734.1 nucleic acid-binding protein [Cereibacter sphaeroides]ATN65927.1 nucleic acid-binding protein [Cereibacter sphaeroides]AXC64007.1 PIN domain-containing protein [Cereibacter sphaeroides 2.4.1]